MGSVPTVAVDKVDGCQARGHVGIVMDGWQGLTADCGRLGAGIVAAACRTQPCVYLSPMQLYLSRESLSTHITTAKSSEVRGGVHLCVTVVAKVGIGPPGYKSGVQISITCAAGSAPRRSMWWSRARVRRQTR